MTHRELFDEHLIGTDCEGELTLVFFTTEWISPDDGTENEPDGYRFPIQLGAAHSGISRDRIEARSVYRCEACGGSWEDGLQLTPVKFVQGFRRTMGPGPAPPQIVIRDGKVNRE